MDIPGDGNDESSPQMNADMNDTEQALRSLLSDEASGVIVDDRLSAILSEEPADSLTDARQLTQSSTRWPSLVAAVIVLFGGLAVATSFLNNDTTVPVATDRSESALASTVPGSLPLPGTSILVTPSIPTTPTVAAPSIAAALNLVQSDLPIPEWLEPRFGHSIVWTGTEVLAWGGAAGSLTDDPAFADGAAYNPSTDTWRELDTAPIAPRSHHLATWTGSEMLVVGGIRDLSDTAIDLKQYDVTFLSDGAAYDPATDTWRAIPDSEVMPEQVLGSDPLGAWTGSEFVIWVKDGERVRSYNPVENQWRDLPGPSLEHIEILEWTGTHLVAVALDGENHSLTVETLGIGDDKWQALPKLEIGPKVQDWDFYAVNAAVADGSLIAWAAAGPDTPTFQLDLETRTWFEIDRAPIERCSANDAALRLQDSVLVVDFCSRNAAFYNSKTELWEVVNTEGGRASLNFETSVWTGSEIIAVDWCCFESAVFELDGTRYRWAE